MISWARRPYIWRGLAAGVVMACVAVAYLGVSNLVSAKFRLAELHAVNQKLAQESRELYRTVTRLRSDPKAVERACRRKMGMVRPDEVVYRAGKPAKGSQ